MWEPVAEGLGVEAARRTPVQPQPLEGRMGHADEVWAGLVTASTGSRRTRHRELASWWHTDADLGREVETFADMSKSRALGFLDFQDSARSFLDLFDTLRRRRSSRRWPDRRSPAPRSERGGTDHAGRGAAPGRRGAWAPPAADRPRPPVAPPAGSAAARAARRAASVVAAGALLVAAVVALQPADPQRPSAPRVVGLGVRIPEPQPAGARPRAIRATYRVARPRGPAPRSSYWG